MHLFCSPACNRIVVFLSFFFPALSHLLLRDANEMMIVRDGRRSTGISMRYLQLRIFIYSMRLLLTLHLLIQWSQFLTNFLLYNIFFSVKLFCFTCGFSLIDFDSFGAPIGPTTSSKTQYIDSMQQKVADEWYI